MSMMLSKETFPECLMCLTFFLSRGGSCHKSIAQQLSATWKVSLHSPAETLLSFLFASTSGHHIRVVRGANTLRALITNAAALGTTSTAACLFWIVSLHVTRRPSQSFLVALRISSPIFFGERPRGPIFGAREDAPGTSPPVARTYTMVIAVGSNLGGILAAVKLLHGLPDERWLPTGLYTYYTANPAASPVLYMHYYIEGGWRRRSTKPPRSYTLPLLFPIQPASQPMRASPSHGSTCRRRRRKRA